MNKAIHRIAGLVMAIVMILGNTIDTKAAGNVYYVSPTGRDTNPGTASAPFKTFAKANSVLKAGSTLYIYAGIYNQRLKITKSGTSSDWINVQPLGGQVVIDLLYQNAPGVDVQASYVSLNQLVVRNVRGVCVNLRGSSNITATGLVVKGCASHGIHINDSAQIKLLNSRVFRTVRSNSRRQMTSGWASGIKVRLSNHVLIQGNMIYHNFGEGIAARGTNITIRENKVFDNYSVNIYTNSENTLIERNFVYCTPNSGFERSGLPATGIGMGEEYFEGWGARLINTRVINNIVAFCRHGIRYNGVEAGVVGGGLKGATFAYNTLYGSINSAISIAYASAQSGSLIANNIIWQAQNRLTMIDSPVGLTFQNNLWKVRPPAAFRGPGDKIGDPEFAGIPGYTPESYRLSSSSPAIGAGVDTGIPHDFYTQPRGPEFDMGAIQLTEGTVTANTQDLSSPTPMFVEPTTTLFPATVQVTASPAPISGQPTSTSTPVSSTPVAPTVTFTTIPAELSPTATAQLTQETIYDNKHSGFVYSAGWVEEIKAAAIDGSFARTSTNNASVTLPFTGQSFSVIYKGGPSYRNMDVYIDDVLVATINERHEVSTYKARWDYPGQLSPGQHILKLVFVTTGSSTNGSLDAVIVR